MSTLPSSKKSDGNETQAPPSDEVEVSLIGPGYGECVVLHLGGGEWVIVDSCLNPITKKPAAEEYLELLGIDPEVAVKLIVSTHWHDDHVRGLASIYSRCTRAEFVCSDALKFDEFR